MSDWMQSARATGIIPPAARGKWRVKQFTVSKEDTICQFGSMFRTGRFVPPGTYTGLYRGQTIVMSDTPDEMRDCRSIIQRASGRVLVNGLGLGCVVRALLAKPEVTQIDVVEIDADVIALIVPHMADKRLVIHHDSAFTFKTSASMKWDYAWHDIWDTLCTDDLEQHTKMKRKYARRVNVWQGCWGEDFLRSQKHRERSYAYAR